jgi:hypothetical protein
MHSYYCALNPHLIPFPQTLPPEIPGENGPAIVITIEHLMLSTIVLENPEIQRIFVSFEFLRYPGSFTFMLCRCLCYGSTMNGSICLVEELETRALNKAQHLEYNFTKCKWISSVIQLTHFVV